MTDVAPTIADIEAAAQRIAPHLHRTPVMTSAYWDDRSGASLVFKCENFQKVGAFKARGATNAVFALDEQAAARGVITHSSGNHGQALAFAAARRGIPATIVMPTGAPASKRAAVLGYGGRVVDCAPSNAARAAAADAALAETGGTLVHPFDDNHVIAGQGTCAAELVADVPDLDAIIAPVGGGGLIAGTCVAVSGRATPIAVYGAEPEAADDARRSLLTGARVAGDDAPQTIADGLKASLGDLNWPIISAHVADIFAVSETEIVAAMRQVYERMKLVIEPSCAVAVAAVVANPDAFAGKRVGIIITGGNVDLDRLPWREG